MIRFPWRACALAAVLAAATTAGAAPDGRALPDPGDGAWTALPEWAAVPAAAPRVYPYEEVPGLYYFTDNGLFRPAAEGQPARFAEDLAAQGGVDFGRRLSLTFDDVYFGASLDRLLDILARERIPATFFLTLTHMAGTDDATLRRQLGRMLAEGHSLGNHSAGHVDFDAPLFKRSAVAQGRDGGATGAEFDRLEGRVAALLGRPLRIDYVRPPFGVRGNDASGIGPRMSLPGRVDDWCRATGRQVVLWHINSLDFLLWPSSGGAPRPAAKLVAEAAARIAGSRGGAVLFHANVRTPAYLEAVLAAIRAEEGKNGPWSFVPIAALLEIKYGSGWSARQANPL